MERQEEVQEDQQSSRSYLKELDLIEKSQEPPEKILPLIDLLARDFLAKKYHVKKISEYDEMSDFFLKKGMPEIATFCHTMVEALYSQNSIVKEKLQNISEELKNLIEKSQEHHQVQPSANSILANLKIWKKQKEKIPAMLGKQTKHLIDLELEEKRPLQEKIAQKPSISQEYQKSITTQVLPSAPASSTDHPLIESIDNLERIKYKIQLRKIVPKYQNQSQVAQS